MKACLYVAPCDLTVLERLIANGKTAQKLAVRARIVLLSGRGFGTMASPGAFRIFTHRCNVVHILRDSLSHGLGLASFS